MRPTIARASNKDIDLGIARAWELVTEAHEDMRIGVFRSLEDDYLADRRRDACPMKQGSV